MIGGDVDRFELVGDDGCAALMKDDGGDFVFDDVVDIDEVGGVVLSLVLSVVALLTSGFDCCRCDTVGVFGLRAVMSSS